MQILTCVDTADDLAAGDGTPSAERIWLAAALVTGGPVGQVVERPVAGYTPEELLSRKPDHHSNVRVGGLMHMTNPIVLLPGP